MKGAAQKIIGAFIIESTRGRDRTGMSVISLVFETSASTNSATRARKGCENTALNSILKNYFMMILFLEEKWRNSSNHCF